MAEPKKSEDVSSSSRKLEHTAGGVTTRDDATDVGVPMLPGRPDEPTGPEDALGVGPKRGDYSGRIGPESYQPHESLRVPDAKPGEPNVVIEAQRPRVSDVGDAPGKGGVTTGNQ
jgi:hypothetical protein